MVSEITLSPFFSARNHPLVFADRCPGCEVEVAGKPYAIVRGHRASEGAGVSLPAVRCPRCNLVYLNPRLSETAIAAFYNESPRLLSYFTTGFKDSVDRARGFIPFVEFIEAALGGVTGDLLDLGCGAGAFIRLMKTRGFDARGAEISASVSNVARGDGLDVITADARSAIKKYREDGHFFDVVTMIHTFEHLPHPLDTLRDLRAVVKPGGLVAINVPNLRYPLAHLDPILGTDLGGIWDPVGHLNYFTLRSLSRVVAQAGFKVVAVNSRLLAYGRMGVLGAIDDTLSIPCRWFGGCGGNISVLGRLGPLE